MPMTIQSSVKDKILAAQSKTSKTENASAEMLRGLDQQMEKKEDGGLYFMDRIWVPLVGSVRTLIMDKAHASTYTVHPRADKTYYDLRDMYGGHPEIPEWKWDRITMDFITRLPRSSNGSRWKIYFVVLADVAESIGNTARYECGLSSLNGWTNYHSSIRCAPFEAFYGRKCRSPVLWAEIGENRLIRPELVQETTDKVVQIKEMLKAVRDRQKRYADNRQHVEIIDGKVKRLKYSRIPIVKVRWNSKRGPEDYMKAKWCITRSSTTELLSHFENPEQKFRSRRRLFDTPSLVESNSPEFDHNFDIDEQSEEEGQFLKELRDNTFSGLEHEDSNKHIEKVLDIVDLFHIPKITQDQIMLRAFHVSFSKAASRWLRNQPSGSITTWEVLKTKFLNKYRPPACTTKKMEEINKA
ncbi:hypothetical protein Tco_0523361 [Tanacetum coccineum]